ncbi:MAG: selenide, water dikinase SelD [Archangium sp.]|nr:selenide, water dikinase SelD [Archangium sp.]MDP3152499.1 selenide, water dikinase SelD [Archangium sp.]MDP3572331.1 selenide, water dikinase SelD [Archangium sp.]
MTAPRLTSLSNCAGCAAKLRPDLLGELLAGIPNVKVKNALVGFETSDDAAVYQLTQDLAVVETVDFFPPVLDDPFAYGQIAAANAMSDIWAMGAKAIFALNVVAFPKELPISMLKEILAGGASKAKEAGIPILGGHSIQSPEPKYGMAVTGTVHPKKVLTNRGGKAGDVLVLTKPIGTGIATTALKRELASKALVKFVTAQMATLNKAAGEVFASGKFKVNALTDVTGFGLLGHVLEVARGAKVKAVLELERVPLMPEIAQLAERGVIPGGTKTNLAHAQKGTTFPAGLPEAIKFVLADAQTNGGLLAAIPEKDVVKAMRALEKKGVEAWAIGYLEKGKGVTVV